MLDENGWLFKEAPLLRTFRLPLHIDLFDEPSRRWEVRLQADPARRRRRRVRASVAELRVDDARHLAGQEDRHVPVQEEGQVREEEDDEQKLFWLTQPTCPASGQLGFESFYKYETGATFTKSVDAPVPRFQL